MKLVQMEECGGFDLTWADRLRKSIAKKNPKEFDQLTIEYFDNMKEKGLSANLCNYVWKVLVAYSRGYGFNKSHTLAYSLIALQEMNLAYRYPIIFWNCACLINDAGGNEVEEDEESEVEEVEINWENNIEDFNLDEDDDDDDDEDEEEVVSKKKKKQKKINYGKISTAIGKMKMEGINVSPPDINYSVFTFSPDPQKNLIRYGLSGITGMGDDAIKAIIANRPYNSLDDLISKVKLKKPQIINLIKAGAFDEFGDSFRVLAQNSVVACVVGYGNIVVEVLLLLLIFRVAHHNGAESRAECQSADARQTDGRGQSDTELSEERAGCAGHEGHGDKHSHEDQSAGYDGDRHIAHGLAGGFTGI